MKQRGTKYPRPLDRGVAGPEPRTTGSSRRKDASLPARFVPRFWEDADRRCAVVREIEARVQRLQADCGADSYQKQLLCERVVFLLAVMETNERAAIEGTGTFDAGSHTQSLNALVGCLRLLGLERKTNSQTLRAYVEGGR